MKRTRGRAGLPTGSFNRTHMAWLSPQIGCDLKRLDLLIGRPRPLIATDAAREQLLVVVRHVDELLGER